MGDLEKIMEGVLSGISVEITLLVEVRRKTLGFFWFCSLEETAFEIDG